MFASEIVKMGFLKKKNANNPRTVAQMQTQESMSPDRTKHSKNTGDVKYLATQIKPKQILCCSLNNHMHLCKLLRWRQLIRPNTSYRKS